jgi:hypothetical protein
MNVSEGMRRLGIALGVCGAVVGGFAGYYLFDSLNQQRVQHQEFEKLLASRSLARLIDHPPYIDDNGNPIDMVPTNPQELHKDGIRSVHFDQRQLAQDHKLLRERVDWVETEDGRLVFRGAAPGVGWYVLASTFPLLGFIAPWGLIKALTWIAMGFSHSQKT